MKIKLLFIILFAFSLPLMAQDDDAQTFTYDGVDRPYFIHVPEGYDGETPTPLVVVLHGEGSSGNRIRDAISVNALADETGSIVVYPNSQDQTWNYAMTASGADDVGFLNALIDEISAEYAVDENNISIAGYSNGGLMALRMRCDSAERFDSVAIVGASPVFDLVDPCLESAPVSTILVLGTADEVYPWNGSAQITDGQFLGTMGVSQSVPFLSGLNQCDAEQASGSEITSAISEERALAQLYPICADGTQFVLIGVVDMAHRWPSGVGVTLRTGSEGTLTQAIWEFLHEDIRAGAETDE